MGGSFALGVLVGASVGGDALRLAATGFVGALTTFSTWVFDTERLARRGQLAVAAANVLLSLAAGLLSVFAGRHLGTAL
jgi:CrcB protein